MSPLSFSPEFTGTLSGEGQPDPLPDLLLDAHDLEGGPLEEEVRPLHDTGRVFNMVLIFFGLGTTTYVAATVVQFMVEGRIRRSWGGVAWTEK